MKTMNLYCYDPKTGKYTETKKAVLDDFETAVKGVPVYQVEENAVCEAPDFQDGYTPYLIDGSWVNRPDPTEEELAEQELIKAKLERAESVSKITVEVDGLVFDGDETAQNRMSRAITMFNAAGLPAGTTTAWVLADSSIAQVTVAQLSKALLLAGQKQTELWLKPYIDEETINAQKSTEKSTTLGYDYD